MIPSREELDEIAKTVSNRINAAGTLDDLSQIKREYLGRKGLVNQWIMEIPNLPEVRRKEIGPILYDLRRALGDQYMVRESTIIEEAKSRRTSEEILDVTLPGWRARLGRRHILTRTLGEIERIFYGMGFEIVDGTEVESDEFNFERLNMGRDHPARDAQDSFYISDDLLLRTHTTVVDAHAMVGRKPPMRILTAGRCYRRDAPDATHMPLFHQVDGFMVGERITMADLKGVLASFARQMFGPQARTRFVPSYFPFTEPSAELAVRFNDRWLELGGCGMFHPRVLEMAGIDPARYTAFAFGLGIDRPAMVRYGIPDIRLFWDNDLRLLEQF